MMRGQADLRETLQAKARELFHLCDPESKGYATKEDLAALRQELPLLPGQLDLVFDALDADGDGRLTLTEFTDGFGMFLGIDNLPRHCWDMEQVEDNEEDDEILEELLDHLGARNLFTDEEYVREMWRRVQKEDPVMRTNFENFIAKMAADLKDSVRDRTNLQSILKNRSQEHEAQVQSLYSEMEEQMRREKEQIMAQEQKKEQRIRDELETELKLKDQQLHELLEEHEKMEKQLAELNMEDSETKHENLKLQKDRDTLESRLAASERMLQDMKNHLTLLRQRSLEEKRNRAQTALKVSEGIALERENLVLELHHLKEINKQLLDEKDELAQTAVQMISTDRSKHNSQIQSEKEECSSRSSRSRSRTSPRAEQNSNKLETPRKLCHTMSLDRTATETHPLAGTYDNRASRKSRSGSRDREDGFLQMKDIQNNLNLPPDRGRDDKANRNLSPNRSKKRRESGQSTGSSPALARVQERRPKYMEEGAAPSRVFKVVFVGDSGVGKTSILQRFCNDDFKSTFSATIGVDFQVKTIVVDGERIALQLWDTAGQERFRSMTHQYFRKADGIIVVYDVTSETSFRNVRNWIHNVKEGAQEGAVILLMGNKVDLCDSDDDRVIRTKDGVRMAEEYGTLFYETSAKTGNSIHEAIEGLASVLKSKEDEAMDLVLKLQEERKGKTKKCC